MKRNAHATLTTLTPVFDGLLGLIATGDIEGDIYLTKTPGCDRMVTITAETGLLDMTALIKLPQAKVGEPVSFSNGKMMDITAEASKGKFDKVPEAIQGLCAAAGLATDKRVSLAQIAGGHKITSIKEPLATRIVRIFDQTEIAVIKVNAGQTPSSTVSIRPAIAAIWSHTMLDGDVAPGAAAGSSSTAPAVSTGSDYVASAEGGVGTNRTGTNG